MSGLLSFLLFVAKDINLARCYTSFLFTDDISLSNLFIVGQLQ